MLSKEVFKDRMLYLTYMYPSWGIELENSKVMKAWYDHFQNITDDDFIDACEKHVKKERFNPTVSSILEYDNSFISRFFEEKEDE